MSAFVQQAVGWALCVCCFAERLEGREGSTLDVFFYNAILSHSIPPKQGLSLYAHTPGFDQPHTLFELWVIP